MSGAHSHSHQVDALFDRINALYREDEDVVIQNLTAEADFTDVERARIEARAIELIRFMREDGKPGLMDMFLAEYGLSTNEGIALMCLAEALLRVPDPGTIDALIEDKIAPHAWNEHFGQSQSALVNASTAALMLTGRVLDDDNSASVLGLLNRTVKRLGEPVVRVAVKRAMKEMGDQFVLGQTIEQAIRRGEVERKKGYLYSYDMLGEAALTAADADGFIESYADAIRAIGERSKGAEIQSSPGISVKLSALHPRFEFAKQVRLEKELVPRVISLAHFARERGLGFNIDAEEADRLEPTLRVFQALLREPSLAGWDGLGLVIQAYGRRAGAVIDWLFAAAQASDRKVMVRLVKGAYWDSEIKRAQIDGVDDFPVFTQRAATDISYMCCAKKLLAMSDRIYPQFATHNAHTLAAILELAGGKKTFEFQRLHGMGEALHNHLVKELGMRCRIYAPVGPHKDLLAYLVRRLLENGANSSFVNQVVDHRLPAAQIAKDPFAKYRRRSVQTAGVLKRPTALFSPGRNNSTGWDLRNRSDVDAIEVARSTFKTSAWDVGPIVAADWQGQGSAAITNPVNLSDVVGQVKWASVADVEAAIAAARPWTAIDASGRAKVLRRAAGLYEMRFGEFFALLAREAGKTQPDAVAELREAVDFLRYYANQAEADPASGPAGVVTCISPWNFPLAIFTRQIAAALAVGNSVLAKPAETTSLIANLAVQCLHEAGVPRTALQFLPGAGRTVGQALVSHPTIAGACFTGSTATAQAINRALAAHAQSDAFLIAETGGLNAGIIDSTALPEQAVRAVMESAFQSAGQRCSALRCLYVQEDVADGFIEMLCGAMDELAMGDPWTLATDIGPVIDATAQTNLQAYIDLAKADRRLLKQLSVPEAGHFVGPALLEVSSILDLEREIFGPVLHIARFAAEEFDHVVRDINQTGYGLTFGLHTRIDERVRDISDQLSAGNLYVNRNQIGAVVESQPFGGEGLSGTGPKAGGPHYVQRFRQAERVTGGVYPAATLQTTSVIEAIGTLHDTKSSALSHRLMPGPTGESNSLAEWPRGLVLCLGPTLEGARRQAAAARNGPIIPVVSGRALEPHCILERHTCIDTTAAGGNTSLLSDVSDAI